MKYNESSTSFGCCWFSYIIYRLASANESHTYTIHRFTDTTGQYLVKAAGEPSLDPVFLLDSDALASAKAATV